MVFPRTEEFLKLVLNEEFVNANPALKYKFKD
jgi:hypothetical protein